jgi:uncharacterized SAM-binding protein YcdF (DUF218 family)
VRIFSRPARSSQHSGEGGRSSATPRMARRRGVPWRAGLIAFLLVALAAATARLFIWPSLPPLPDHADAIIELGGPGNRDAVTIALAEAHLAPLVIQSTVARDATSNTCLPPIPDTTIECFHAVPPTTRGEARYIGDRGVAEHWSSVIIVTTPDHAWRARLRVERCFQGQVYVKTSPLPKLDWFRQIPYQWMATIKAELIQRDC